MLEQFEARIKELTQQLEQSLVNHNFLAGALNEVKVIKELYQKIHNAIPALDDTTSEIEEGTSVIESVVE